MNEFDSPYGSELCLEEEDDYYEDSEYNNHYGMR